MVDSNKSRERARERGEKPPSGRRDGVGTGNKRGRPQKLVVSITGPERVEVSPNEMHNGLLEDAAVKFRDKCVRLLREAGQTGHWRVRMEPRLGAAGSAASYRRKPDLVLSEGEESDVTSSPEYRLVADLKTTGVALAHPKSWFRKSMQELQQTYAGKAAGLVMAYRPIGRDPRGRVDVVPWWLAGLEFP
jgi:hypothetical protein